MIVIVWVLHRVLCALYRHGHDYASTALATMGNCITQQNGTRKSKRKNNASGQPREEVSISQAAMPSDGNGAIGGATSDNSHSGNSQALSHSFLANGTPLVTTLTFPMVSSSGVESSSEVRRHSGGSVHGRSVFQASIFNILRRALFGVTQKKKCM